MRIVLLGPPASGKGTQGRRLSASLGLAYLSTGALLRENVAEHTPLGLAAAPILARGEYLPDDLMNPLLADWLDKNDTLSGWVLDGFPRSLPQALFLDRWLAEKTPPLPPRSRSKLPSMNCCAAHGTASNAPHAAGPASAPSFPPTISARNATSQPPPATTTARRISGAATRNSPPSHSP